MESANRVPIGFSGYDAFDCPWVVPAPGLTGIAITLICPLLSGPKLMIFWTTKEI